MRWAISLAFAAVIAGAMPAAADSIASPPIYGGLRQAYAVCSVFNSGSTAIPIGSFFLYSDLGDSMSSRGVCPTSLGSNKTCSASFAIANDRAYSCRVSLTGKANARGAIAGYQRLRVAGPTAQVDCSVDQRPRLSVRLPGEGWSLSVSESTPRGEPPNGRR